MAATKRLHKELDEIRKTKIEGLKEVISSDSNILKWELILAPTEAPFSKAMFKIDVIYPAEYPFKPPKLTFVTKIYHPNIDEKGQVCLPIISPENWKPATKTAQVISALIHLVEVPEPEHPLRGDLAEEYTKDRKKFFKNAEEFCRKHGIPH